MLRTLSAHRNIMLTSCTTVPASLLSALKFVPHDANCVRLYERYARKQKAKNVTWLHTLSSLDRFTFLSLKLFQLMKLYTAERGRKIITNDGKEKVLNNATVAYSIIFFFSWFARKEYDKARKTESG